MSMRDMRSALDQLYAHKREVEKAIEGLEGVLLGWDDHSDQSLLAPAPAPVPEPAPMGAPRSSGLTDKVVECLRQHGKAMTPDEITNALVTAHYETTAGSVRSIVSKGKKRGLFTNPSYGQWGLSEWQPNEIEQPSERPPSALLGSSAML